MSPDQASHGDGGLRFWRATYRVVSSDRFSRVANLALTLVIALTAALSAYWAQAAVHESAQQAQSTFAAGRPYFAVSSAKFESPTFESFTDTSNTSFVAVLTNVGTRPATHFAAKLLVERHDAGGLYATLETSSFNDLPQGSPFRFAIPIRDFADISSGFRVGLVITYADPAGGTQCQDFLYDSNGIQVNPLLDSKHPGDSLDPATRAEMNTFAPGCAL